MKKIIAIVVAAVILAVAGWLILKPEKDVELPYCKNRKAMLGLLGVPSGMLKGLDINIAKIQKTHGVEIYGCKDNELSKIYLYCHNGKVAAVESSIFDPDMTVFYAAKKSTRNFEMINSSDKFVKVADKHNGDVLIIKRVGPFTQVAVVKIGSADKVYEAIE